MTTSPAAVRSPRFWWALAVLVGCIVVARPALAANLLTGVRLGPTAGNGLQLSLSFSGAAPAYRLIGTGTADVRLAFPDTLRAPNVAPSLAKSGPLAGGAFSAAGSELFLDLHLTAPTPVNVVSTAQSVLIQIQGGAVPEPAPSPAPTAIGAPAGAVPGAPRGSVVTEVVLLKYADVSEIVGVLVSGQTIAPNDVFVPQNNNFLTTPTTSVSGGYSSSTFGFPASTASSFPIQSGGVQSVGQRINDNVAIDRRLNAIILMGTPEQVADLRGLIDKIDIPLQSVLLETQVVELTESSAKDLGFDFSAADGTIANGTYKIQNLATGQGALNLQAAIFARILRGGGRVLARPRIVAQSGMPASILTGDALPIITNITFPSSGTVVQQQVQYINVGVNLQIQPRISSDGFVTSHIFSEVSSVTDFIQSIPRISQRQAVTTVTVRDGEAFIIGGLLQEQEIRNMSKLPFLGDLPIIGSLFRVYHQSRQNTNLYIVITPHVLRPAAPNAPATKPAG